MAGKLNESQHYALVKALQSHATSSRDESVTSNSEYNRRMANVISMLNESGLRCRDASQSWRQRLETFSSWFEVRGDDGDLRLIDKKTNSLVIPCNQWESAVMEAWRQHVGIGDMSGSKAAIGKRISETLNTTHSMDSRRFGIRAAFVEDVVFKKKNESPFSQSGGPAESRIDGGTSIADKHNGLDVHYFLSVHQDHVNAGFTPYIQISGARALLSYLCQYRSCMCYIIYELQMMYDNNGSAF